MSMDSIPKALQYGTVANSQARVVRQKIQPLGVSSGTSGTTVRFLLPQKAIIDMRSLSFHYDYRITGLTVGAANFTNAQFPPTYQHWNSVKLFVSGASAAGSQCNHYDMVHHAMLKASAGEDYCHSRLNNAYDSIINSPAATNPGATSKTLRATFDDLLLFRSKNYCYDSSLFGNLEIELTFNNKNILKVAAAGTKGFVDGDANATAAALANSYAEVNHEFQNIVLAVDTVVSISPLYVSLLSERLQVSQPIRMPFSEIRTVLASNTGSNRITLQSSCVDAVLVCFTNQDPNSGAAVADVRPVSNVARYRFNVTDAEQMGFQLTIGSEVFPRQAISRLHELLDITTNSIYGNDARSTNLLYHGTSAAAGAQTYILANAADANAISLTKFAIGTEGWDTGILAGLQTNGIATDCVVSSNQANAARLLIASLQTSQVVFDPATSAVSIEA